jgi:hypothetical protein
MTQIKGFIKASRRPGELGIHSLDHFHFVVPDPSVAQYFCSEFGLDVREKGNVLTINTHGHLHQWGTIGEKALAAQSAPPEPQGVISSPTGL